MCLLPALSSPMVAITTTGFVATVSQIVILRELLVLFYGNELSAGLILTAWLLWSGLGSGISGKWTHKARFSSGLIGGMLVLLAAALPISLLLIRATRIIWALPAGELPSIGNILLISFAATGLVCPISGALFGICWAVHRPKGMNQPLGIYLGEALGSAAGGLIFYFVFLPYCSAFTIVWVTSGMILLISGLLFRPWHSITQMRLGHLMWTAVSFLVAAGAVFGPRLDHMSRQWQWGTNLSVVYDTAYHNIALLKKEGQISVFANGLWLFSEPDRLSAEHGVHLALLQHPNPRTILLMGGGIAGHLEELLKHPGIRRIDYLEMDPDFIPLIKLHLSSATDAWLKHTGVRLFHQDFRIFLRSARTRYDVILMNMGDPITAQMNRFYTEQFFALVKKRLLPGGVFSFAVSGGESMLGPTQARFLGSINRTLLQIFPKTLIYPGDHLRFFASRVSGRLISDASVLAERISQRNLQLTYIREDILQDALSPFRLGYLKAILEDIPDAAINRDFYPICYLHTLMMWTTQWHDILKKGLDFIADLKLPWLWSLLSVLGIAVIGVFWTGRSKFRLAVAGSIFISGAVEMVLQLNFLLSFQIIEGFVYRQLALIIALFMTGLAVGAGWISRRYALPPKTGDIRRRFICVQALLCALPIGLMLLLPLIHTDFRALLPPTAMGWLFSGLSLLTGFLGGAHFALAVKVTAETGVALERIGGAFYALDLAGAAAGVLIAALIILPVYGIINTLVFLSILSGISLLTLLRRP